MLTEMIRHYLTRFAEWWLDVDHQNLLEVGVGTIGARGEFIPWQTRFVPMTLNRARLRPRRPVLFDAAVFVTITHYSWVTDENEWRAPKVFPSGAKRLMAGDSLNLRIKIGLS